MGLGKGVGYVFVQSAYASAGITSLRGQGFVLAHVNGKWSAPAYISVTKLSAGMSIGAPQATTGRKRSHTPGCEGVARAEVGTLQFKRRPQFLPIILYLVCFLPMVRLLWSGWSDLLCSIRISNLVIVHQLLVHLSLQLYALKECVK